MNCQEITKKINQLKTLKHDFDVAYDLGDKKEANDLKNQFEIIFNELKEELYYFEPLTKEEKREFHKLMKKIKNEISDNAYFYGQLTNYLNKSPSKILDSLKLTQINSIVHECELYYKPNKNKYLISSILTVFINNKIKEDDKVVLNIKNTKLNGSLTFFVEHFSKGTLVIKGDVKDNLGLRMTGGNIIVEGDARDYSGNGMENGTIEISGDTGACCGYYMDNGTIKITGNTGEACGVSSKGGRIEFNGSIENIADDCKAEVYHKGIKVRN